MTSQFRIIHEQDYWTYHSKLMKLLIFVSLLSINQDKMLFTHNSFIYCIQYDQNKTSNSSDPANNTFVWFFLIFLKYLLYRRPLQIYLRTSWKTTFRTWWLFSSLYKFYLILFYFILFHLIIFLLSYLILFLFYFLFFLFIFVFFYFFILFYFILFYFILF